MKDKNLPDDNNSQTLDELTKDINQIIEQLEKEKNLENSLNNYQKLIKLNNIIVRKFQKKSKYINEITQQKIRNIVNKKNAKKT
jgi:exonuclease VII small subunit